MSNKNFNLRLEPVSINQPIHLRGIEAKVGLNVNGIEVLETAEDSSSQEHLYSLVHWLLENYHDYTSEGMPKKMSPAVELFKIIDNRETDVCHNIAPKGSTQYMDPLPKFDKWRYNHTLGYHDMTLPIIFQRRSKGKMEISWDLPPRFYKNLKGCEYVPLEIFQAGIKDAIDNGIKAFDASKDKIPDYEESREELTRLRGKIK